MKGKSQIGPTGRQARTRQRRRGGTRGGTRTRGDRLRPTAGADGALGMHRVPANGAPWHYKGQHGTAYTVLGVNGASCATGAKLVPGWTRGGGDLKRVPAGWHCSATLAGKLGECTTSKGGIFEWSPRHKP